MKTIVGCAVALSLLGAQAALSQVPTMPPKVRDWRTHMSSNNGKSTCALSAAIVDAEHYKQYVLEYTTEHRDFLIKGAGEKFKQAGIKVDNDAPIPFKCNGDVCSPSTDILQSRLFAQMEKGKTAFVALQTIDGKTVGPFAVPLASFSIQWDNYQVCAKIK